MGFLEKYLYWQNTSATGTRRSFLSMVRPIPSRPVFLFQSTIYRNRNTHQLTCAMYYYYTASRPGWRLPWARRPLSLQRRGYNCRGGAGIRHRRRRVFLFVSTRSPGWYGGGRGRGCHLSGWAARRYLFVTWYRYLLNIYIYIYIYIYVLVEGRSDRKEKTYQ